MTIAIDFFISHNRAEKDWAKALSAALRQRGAKIFLDEESIDYGQDIVSAIGRALESSKHVVFVLSQRSVKSRWVELEWTSSLYMDPNAESRRVIPILKEDCEIPFLLRRLRYIDARDSDVTHVAETLLSVLKHDRSILKLESRRTPTIQLSAPLRFGSPQYIEREPDHHIETALEYGHPLFLYGPLMVGKTSMLHRVSAIEGLRGNPVVWIDLQAFGHAEDTKSLFQSLGATIAWQLDKIWRPSEAPVSDFCLLLEEVCLANDERRVVLLIDECDLIQVTPAGADFGIVLRSLISHRACANLRCIAAGFMPPWRRDMRTWNESVVASPWWNVFQAERVRYFSHDQSALFFGRLGCETATDIEALTSFTGGHPALIAGAGHEFVRGKSIGEILSDPLKVDGPFFPVAWNIVQSAKHLLRDYRDLLTRLLDGREVSRIDDREDLCFIGLTSDPWTNPPKVSGEVFRGLIERLLNQELRRSGDSERAF